MWYVDMYTYMFAFMTNYFVSLSSKQIILLCFVYVVYVGIRMSSIFILYTITKIQICNFTAIWSKIQTISTKFHFSCSILYHIYLLHKKCFIKNFINLYFLTLPIRIYFFYSYIIICIIFVTNKCLLILD